MLRQIICRLGTKSKPATKNIFRCLSTSTEPKIRQMHPNESAVLNMGQTHGGARLRTSDLKLISALDKEGFFIAVSDESEVVGTIGAIRLTDDLGFICFGHVENKFEEKGIQEKLWEKALDHLGDRNIGIEVPESDVEKCEDLGFKAEWRNGRFQGVGVELPPEVFANNQAIRPLQGMAMGKVIDYDTTASGMFKVPLVLGWCKGATGYAAVEQDQRVMGYGVIHPLHNPSQHRIAPLLAENVGIAQILLVSLLSSVPKQKVFIDTPLSNPTFVNILTRDLQMQQVGETVRMYTKGDPGFPVQKAFGILSPDAGC